MHGISVKLHVLHENPNRESTDYMIWKGWVIKCKIHLYQNQTLHVTF